MYIQKTPVNTGTIGITGDKIYLYLIVSTIKRKKRGYNNRGIIATDQPPTTNNHQAIAPTSSLRRH